MAQKYFLRKQKKKSYLKFWIFFFITSFIKWGLSYLNYIKALYTALLSLNIRALSLILSVH